MATVHIAQGNAHYKSRSYEQAAESYTCALEELSVPPPTSLRASFRGLCRPLESPPAGLSWRLSARLTPSSAPALRRSAKEHGDFSPESADVLLAYGKTLLELGIASNEVMNANGGAAAGPGELESDVEGAEGEGAEADEGEDVKSSECCSRLPGCPPVLPRFRRPAG